MVRFEYETLTAKAIDVAANLGKLKTIELPTNKWIQQIIIDLKGTFTTTDVGFAPQQDNPMGLIKKVELQGEGGKNGTYLTQYGVDGEHGFSRLYHEDSLEKAMLPFRTILGSGALTAAAFRAVAVMDFRLNPRDEDEFIKQLPDGKYTTALLPAWAFNQLNLNLQLGDHTNLRTDAGTNNSFPTATVTVTVKTAVLEESDPDIPIENTLELATLEQVHAADLSVMNNFDIYPVLGHLARRYLIWTIDTANKVRKNDVVSAYRVKQTAPINWQSDDISWDASQIQDAREYGVSSQEAGYPFREGISVIDFDNNRDLEQARNLTGIPNKDAFKLKFDIATAANRKFILTEKLVK
jgi:hypothetical protein